MEKACRSLPVAAAVLAGSSYQFPTHLGVSVLAAGLGEVVVDFDEPG